MYTVYMAQGAVDDSSGTATVLEMARHSGLIESQMGKPKHTIYFCTWGEKKKDCLDLQHG